MSWGNVVSPGDVILFDTTSTYFETEDDDEFRRYGNSKDHWPDRPQVVVGLAVTREGIPGRGRATSPASQ